MSTKVATKNRQKGDIIFFNNGTKGNHIGIYTSGNKMLHCYKGGGVKETDISYGGHLVGYGRLWQEVFTIDTSSFQRTINSMIDQRIMDNHTNFIGKIVGININTATE